jgi:multidrug resistance efflux pump
MMKCTRLARHWPGRLAARRHGAAPAPADDGADVQALANQLEQLKASYAQEVRRLRELDMQVQAMQARLSGKVARWAPAAATPSPRACDGATPARRRLHEGYASTAEAQQAKQESRRSVDDVKQQQRRCSRAASPSRTASPTPATTASSSPSTASWRWMRSSSATSPSRTSSPIRSPTTWPRAGASART